MKIHCHYHEQLKEKNLNFYYPDRVLKYNYPCLAGCDQEFDTYNAYTKHKNEFHPDFLHECRWPGCNYQGLRLNRIEHWKNVHANIGFHCEVD